MPPKLTDTSTTSRTACGSRRSVPAGAAKSVAGADKAALLLEEDRGRAALGPDERRRRLAVHAEDLAQLLGALRDLAADAVGVAADAARREPGEQELVAQEVGQVGQERRKERERERAEQHAGGGVDAADA